MPLSPGRALPSINTSSISHATSAPSSPLLSPLLSPLSPKSVSPRSTSRPPSPSVPQATSSSIYLRVPNQSSSPTSPPSGDAAASPTSPTDTFEMEPIAAGHRRRRSSLMSPQSGPAAPANASSLAGSNPNNGGAGAGPGAAAQGHDTIVEGAGRYGDDDDDDDDDGDGDVVGAAESGRLLDGSGGSSSKLADDSEDDSYTSSGDDVRDDEETGLSRKERRKRRKRRDRNLRLDQRIASGNITAEEKKEADQNVIKSSAINLFFILSWYFFSLMISIYNKWMFGEGRLNFAFPLFTTCFHMVVQFILASIVLYCVPSLRPQRRSDRGRSRHQPEVAEKPLMSWFFYLTRIGPCGAATGLDIGLGNMSLKFITLTFYTMCKSSALAFVLLFAFVFRLETPTWRLIGIIATMTIGVVMMVAGEVEFRLGGFVLVIAAAFFSGFRWGLTQILLLRNPATSNPFSSVFFLAPVMFVTLLAIAIPVEGPVALYHGYMRLGEQRGFVEAPLILLFPGCIAFLMTVSEFALLQRTSVVTLSIAGICKEVVTIIAATMVFGDTLTPINFVGLITTIGAISAYNYIKIHKMREDAQDDVHRLHATGGAAAPVLPQSSPLVADDEGNGGAGTFSRVDHGVEEPLFSAQGDVIATLPGGR